MRDVEDKYLVMVTTKGTIKKTPTNAFRKVRSTGIRAVTLNEGDELIFCSISRGNDTIVIATHNGQGIRFNEDEVRPMGRQAAGVRGIRLKGDDYVVGLQVLANKHDILFATSRGYGKRVRIEDFRVAHRGGMGVRTIPTEKRNGSVIGLVQVSDISSLLLIDTKGKIIRLSPSEIRTMGRQAKGVRLIKLDPGQELSSVVSFETEEESSNTDSSGGGTKENVTEKKVFLDSESTPSEVVEVSPAVISDDDNASDTEPSEAQVTLLD